MTLGSQMQLLPWMLMGSVEVLIRNLVVLMVVHTLMMRFFWCRDENFHLLVRLVCSSMVAVPVIMQEIEDHDLKTN